MSESAGSVGERIEELEKALADKDKEISSMSEVHRDLRSTIASKNSEVDSLGSRLSELSGHVDANSLENERIVAGKEGEIAKLTKDLNDLQASLNDSEAQVVAKIEEMSSLHEKHLSLEREFEEFKRDSASTASQVASERESELLKQVENLQDQLKMKIKVHTDDLVAKGECEKQIKKLESELEEKQKELGVNEINFKEREKSLISECDVMSDKLTVMEEKCFALEEEMGKKLEDEAILKHEMEDREVTIANMNTKLTVASEEESQLQSRVKELTATNEEAQENISKLQEGEKALERLVTGLREKIVNLEGELVIREKEIADHEVELVERIHGIEEQEVKIAQISETMSHKFDDSTQGAFEINSLQIAIEQKNTELLEKNALIEEYEKQIESLGKKVTYLETAVENLSNENTQKDAEITKQAAEIVEKTDQIAKDVESMKSLNTKVDDVKSELSKAKEDIHDLTKELSESQEKATFMELSLEHTKDDLEMKCEEITTNLEAKCQEIKDELEGECKELKVNLEEKCQELKSLDQQWVNKLKKLEEEKDDLAQFLLDEQQRKFDEELKLVVEEHEKKVLLKMHEGETNLSLYEEKDAECKDLQRTLESTKAELQGTLESVKTELKEKLASSIAEVKEWQDKYDQGVGSLKDKTEKLKESEAKVEELSGIVSDLEKKVKKHEDDIANSSEELKQKKNELSLSQRRLIEQIEQTNHAATKSSSDISALEDKVDELTKQLQATSKELDSKSQSVEVEIHSEEFLRKEVDRLENIVEKLDEEKSSIYETSAAKIGALEENVSHLELNIKTWEEKYALAMKESAENLNNREAALQQKQDENAKLQGDINILHEKISSTNNELSKKDSEITSLKDANNEVDTILQTSAATVLEIEGKYQQASTTLEATRVEKAALEKEIESLRVELKEARSEAGSYRQRNDDLDTKVRSLTASVRQLSDTAENYQKDVERLEDELKEARNCPESIDGAVTVVDIEGIASVASHEEKSHNDSNKDQHDRIDELTETLQAVTRDRDDKVVQLEELKTTLELTRADLSAKNQELLDQVAMKLSVVEEEGDADASFVVDLSSADVDELQKQLKESTERIQALQRNNAKLLQRLQRSNSNIQVCCRTRPFSDAEIKEGGKSSVQVVEENELLCFDRRSNEWKSFVFDKCWKHNAKQEEVFTDVEPLALSVAEGYNASIIAYGQTGSGKTYTMNGTDVERGVSYRTLRKIFKLLEFKKLEHMNQQKKNENGSSEFTYSITVSMMEIYNEQVKDLLCSADGNNENSAKLEIRLNPDGEVFVQGLTKHKIQSIQEVLDLFHHGSTNRATTATNLNEHSSRSHSILVVEVMTTITDEPSSIGKLYLVDLAGSEKVGKSGVTGAAMKEAQNINRSLSALGDVMEALDQKSKHVPYRNSALTFLLQNSLSGNARTMMLITVCPSDLTAEETLFTLQFASRIRNIQLGSARKNINSSVKNLSEQLGSLKNELRDSKKKRMVLEEQLNEAKKHHKGEREKINVQTDAKLSRIEEARKTADAMVAQLQKSNAEMTTKLSREKQDKASISVEVEGLKRSNRRLEDKYNAVLKEKEELQFTINGLRKQATVSHKQNTSRGHNVASSSSRLPTFNTSGSDRTSPATVPNDAVSTSTNKQTSHSQNLMITPISKKNDEKNAEEIDTEDDENKNAHRNKGGNRSGDDDNTAEYILEVEVDEDVSFKPLAALKEKLQNGLDQRSSRVAKVPEGSSGSNAPDSSVSRASKSIQSKQMVAGDPSPSPSVNRKEFKEPSATPTATTKRSTARNSSIPRSSLGASGSKSQSTPLNPASRSERESASSATSSIAMRTKDALARHKDRMMKRYSTSN